MMRTPKSLFETEFLLIGNPDDCLFSDIVVWDCNIAVGGVAWAKEAQCKDSSAETSFGPALAICEGLANFDVSVAQENWVKANVGWNKDN